MVIQKKIKQKRRKKWEVGRGFERWLKFIKSMARANLPKRDMKLLLRKSKER